MAEHTPTPWHHGVANRGIVWSGTKIKSHIVANCYDDTTTSEQQHLDAAFIVKAANNHDAMDKLLAEAADFLNVSPTMDGMDIGAKITQFRLAMQKAGTAPVGGAS